MPGQLFHEVSLTACEQVNKKIVTLGKFSALKAIAEVKI